MAGAEQWQSGPLSSRKIRYLVIYRWWSIVNTLLSIILAIAVLTNGVCIAWSYSFLVLSSNGNPVWLCLVKSVSFISLGG